LIPPDEHGSINAFGRTRRYAQWRDGIRAYYRRNFPLTGAAMRNPRLNPGGASVSPISHLPKVGLVAMEEMLAPAIAAGKLRIFTETEPIAAEAANGKINAVRFRDKRSGYEFEVAAAFTLDATEEGDLLPLAGVEMMVGAESKHETGEPHAPEKANPEDAQAMTWCMALAYDPDCKEPCDEYQIERPRDYDFWKNYRPSLPWPWPGPLLGWKYWVGWEATGHFFRPAKDHTERDMWLYRRVLDASIFETPKPCHEITVLNWWHNDFYEASLLNKTAEERKVLLGQARQQTLSLAYWLQNEAPHENGEGYPGLYARPDVTGTEDGMAQYPYIREARRIRGLATITENDIGLMARDGQPPEQLRDSCGVAQYHMDIHPTNHMSEGLVLGWSSSFPSQIPLGALIPREWKNLLAAGKNLGVTHLANGAYRLHPIEWNVGEAAGALAAFCLDHHKEPAEVWSDDALLGEYQQSLAAQGVEMHWPYTDNRARVQYVNERYGLNLTLPPG
jgi:hypothetical protein